MRLRMIMRVRRRMPHALCVHARICIARCALTCLSMRVQRSCTGRTRTCMRVRMRGCSRARRARRHTRASRSRRARWHARSHAQEAAADSAMIRATMAADPRAFTCPMVLYLMRLRFEENEETTVKKKTRRILVHIQICVMRLTDIVASVVYVSVFIPLHHVALYLRCARGRSPAPGSND